MMPEGGKSRHWGNLWRKKCTWTWTKLPSNNMELGNTNGDWYSESILFYQLQYFQLQQNKECMIFWYHSHWLIVESPVYPTILPTQWLKWINIFTKLLILTVIIPKNNPKLTNKKSFIALTPHSITRSNCVDVKELC